MTAGSSIYLDWNATTPPHPDVLEAMARAQRDAWANPASVHRPGQRARAQLDRARAAIADLLQMSARDVLLTSGGTEANNLALRSVRGPLVVSRVEHPSIVRTAEQLAREDQTVAWIDPEPDGRVPPARFEERIAELVRAGTPPALVTIQAANHETGAIQPVSAIAAIAHAHGALVHCDAVQAAGKIGSGHWRDADLVTIAGHKLRGPKGIGALVTRLGIEVTPILRGGDQERGLRPGTQDPAAAAGLAIAAERAIDGAVRYRPLAAMRDDLEARLVALAARHGVAALVNGPRDERVPHVTNLSFEGWRGPELCAALDLEGVAVSSGAACSAGTAEPSRVIAAMLGAVRARAAVRLSLGDTTTTEEIDGACAAFARVLSRSA
jgi:cysteine desulfurase